jgi:hypothetical protein
MFVFTFSLFTHIRTALLRQSRTKLFKNILEENGNSRQWQPCSCGLSGIMDSVYFNSLQCRDSTGEHTSSLLQVPIESPESRDWYSGIGNNMQRTLRTVLLVLVHIPVAAYKLLATVLEYSSTPLARVAV